MKVLPCSLELLPVHACLLEMLDSVLQHFLLSHKLRNIYEGILASVLLKYLDSISKVFILILQHKDVRIQAIYDFTLLLDCLSQIQVALQDFLHHIHRVNNSLSNGILALIGSTWQVGHWLVHVGYILECFAFIFEELLNVVFVLYDSFRYNSSSL